MKPVQGRRQQISSLEDTENEQFRPDPDVLVSEV